MGKLDAYVTGVGQSEIGQRLARHPLLLTVDAVREALADAGLSVGQIDGVSTYPGKAAAYLGFSPVGCEDLIEAMGIRARWFLGGSEQTAQLGAIAAAAAAVSAGLARHVICFRTVYEAGAMSRPEDYPRPAASRAEGDQQWYAPFRAFSAANWAAQYAMRHVKKYGLKREQLGQIALTGRNNALLNPRALVKKPLILDDYMAARMISEPLCLFDCDQFTDASTVIIVSAGDALGDANAIPIRIAAAAHLADRYSWDQAEWLASYQTGRELWSHTDYTPGDIDIAQLYDGFSILALTWIEALGFCKPGEGGEFVEGGTRIALDGDLPLNTFGGQIGAGRLHGFGFAHEAVVQLRRQGGGRQVPGEPRLAVATSGGGGHATALLLARD